MYINFDRATEEMIKALMKKAKANDPKKFLYEFIYKAYLKL
jgi:hypothetical protein